MILVDSSVWIDHFRHVDAELAALLYAGQVVCHPFVVGELACGYLPRRQAVFDALADLPLVRTVPHDDVLAFVERHSLMARGIGRVDMHLLTSAIVSGRIALLSRDKRLAAAAAEHGIAFATTR